MFAYGGALVNASNKKYRNLFYDKGLAMVAKAEAGHACGRRRRQSGGFSRAGGLRGRVAVLEQKSLRNVVDKYREPRQWRRGYATKETFAVNGIFAVLQ